MTKPNQNYTPKPHKYSYKGATYKSLTSLFDAIYADDKEKVGFTVASLRNYLKAGLTVEEVMQGKRPFRKTGKVYEFNGMVYPSLLALVRDSENNGCEVTHTTIKSRLAEGWDLHKAATTKRAEDYDSLYGKHVIEGVEYNSLIQVADAYDMTHTCIYQRYRRGHRGEDVVSPEKLKSYVPPVKEKSKSKINKRKRPMSVDGVEFESKIAALEHFGIKQGTFNVRIARGLTVEQALGVTPFEDNRSKRVSKLYDYDGKQYSMAQLSKTFKVPPATILDRLNRGLSMDQVLGFVPYEHASSTNNGKFHEKKAITAYGVEYESLSDCARAHNIKVNSLSNRIKTHPNEPVEKMIESIKGHNIEFRGKRYKSVRQVAEAFGLKDYVVQQRMSLLGLSLDEAIDYQGKLKKTIVLGMSFNSKFDAYAHFNVREYQVKKRLELGFSEAQAWGVEPLPPRATEIEYDGKVFYGYKALGEHVGVNPQTIAQRMNRGMSVDEAVKPEPIKGVGRYNEKILERDPELANGPGTLYFVTVTINGEKLHKVGVTKRTTIHRLKRHEDVNIICEYHSTLLDVVRKEQKLLRLLKSYHANDIDQAVDGYTEILRLTEQEAEVVKSCIESQFK